MLILFLDLLEKPMYNVYRHKCHQLPDHHDLKILVGSAGSQRLWAKARWMHSTIVGPQKSHHYSLWQWIGTELNYYTGISLWSSEAPEGWVVGRWGCKSEISHSPWSRPIWAKPISSTAVHCLEVGWGTWLHCFALHWTAAMQCTVSNLHWNVLYTALFGDCAVYITQHFNVLHYPRNTFCTLNTLHSVQCTVKTHTQDLWGMQWLGMLSWSIHQSLNSPTQALLFFCPIHARGLLNVRFSRIA